MAAEQPALRVSVIIPTYNRAGYLREALDSVFAQTLPPWEVIVIDDGSTDDTLQVVNNAPGPVRFYQQAHQGVAAARNLGLRYAAGDLIAWLDSDDLWEQNFLATVVPVLAHDGGPHGTYTGVTMIDAQGSTLQTSVHVESAGDLYAALVRDCFLATPSIVAKKACYDQVGGFDPQFRISEDYDMWLRLAGRFRILGIPKPLVRIRVHATNTMSDVDALAEARLALIKKHFGNLHGETSPESVKAAYGYAYRSIAIKYIEHGDVETGWICLEKAATLLPAILERLDTFYEIALGDQPRGYRGQTEFVNLERNGAEMLRRLESLFATADRPIQALRSTSHGNAYLALAMLNDQAHDWSTARRQMFLAAWHNPGLISGPYLRRLGKLILGKRLVNLLRG